MRAGTKQVQLALLVLSCAGGVACHRQSVHAASPPAAPQPAEGPQPAPANPPGTETATKPAPANTGSEAPSTENAPAATHPAKPVEPKPKPVAPQSAAPPAEAPAPKPAPPQITMRMPPAEEAELKRLTQSAVAEAEANLRRASGRDLNEAQRDLVEKIQSFLAQSHEAGEIPDWSRARILAEKARLLSTELVNSL